MGFISSSFLFFKIISKTIGFGCCTHYSQSLIFFANFHTPTKKILSKKPQGFFVVGFGWNSKKIMGGNGYGVRHVCHLHQLLWTFEFYELDDPMNSFASPSIAMGNHHCQHLKLQFGDHHKNPHEILYVNICCRMKL